MFLLTNCRDFCLRGVTACSASDSRRTCKNAIFRIFAYFSTFSNSVDFSKHFFRRASISKTGSGNQTSESLIFSVSKNDKHYMWFPNMHQELDKFVYCTTALKAHILFMLCYVAYILRSSDGCPYHLIWDYLSV